MCYAYYDDIDITARFRCTLIDLLLLLTQILMCINDLFSSYLFNKDKVNSKTKMMISMINDSK